MMIRIKATIMINLRRKMLMMIMMMMTINDDKNTV